MEEENGDDQLEDEEDDIDKDADDDIDGDNYDAADDPDVDNAAAADVEFAAAYNPDDDDGESVKTSTICELLSFSFLTHWGFQTKGIKIKCRKGREKEGESSKYVE